MQRALGEAALQCACAESEGGEQRGRGQGKAGPRRKPAQVACAQKADGKADLAARRAGQELAERDEVDVGAFVEPAPPLDELGAKIADMRDRAAKAGESKAEEDAKHF